jgi:hypothetical protein
MTAENKAELDRQLHEIASEIEGFLLSGDVLAVAAVIVKGDGSLTTRLRYLPGGKLPMLAGMTLVQAQAVKIIEGQP